MIPICVLALSPQQRLETIKTFLQTFESEEKGNRHGDIKYMKLITEVKQLKRSLVEVSLQDVAKSEQSSLLPNIMNNTMRYVELFEDAIDEILPTIHVTAEPTRSADLFNVMVFSFPSIIATSSGCGCCADGAC